MHFREPSLHLSLNVIWEDANGNRSRDLSSSPHQGQFRKKKKKTHFIPESNLKLVSSPFIKVCRCTEKFELKTGHCGNETACDVTKGTNTSPA